MPPTAQSPSSPSSPSLQGRAWRMLLETHRDLLSRLEHELEARAGVDLQTYDVLLHVSEGAEGRRMCDLADAVVLSKSGLTSLVDRLEAGGLLERRPDTEDRRVVRVHLTRSGGKRFAAASRHHRAIVKTLFTSRLTEEEAKVILEALDRVRAGLRSRGHEQRESPRLRPTQGS